MRTNWWNEGGRERERALIAGRFLHCLMVPQTRHPRVYFNSTMVTDVNWIALFFIQLEKKSFSRARDNRD